MREIAMKYVCLVYGEEKAIGAMTDEQLALKPAPDRWPLWATVGHTACQRVFWLCDFAGEPGAKTTPFTNAGYNCPGDDDLENVLSAEQLGAALDSLLGVGGMAAVYEAVHRNGSRGAVKMLHLTKAQADLTNTKAPATPEDIAWPIVFCNGTYEVGYLSSERMPRMLSRWRRRQRR
jgi:hypothetical protein